MSRLYLKASRDLREVSQPAALKRVGVRYRANILVMIFEMYVLVYNCMSRKCNDSDICAYEGVNLPQQIGIVPCPTVGKVHNVHEDTRGCYISIYKKTDWIIKIAYGIYILALDDMISCMCLCFPNVRII